MSGDVYRCHNCGKRYRRLSPPAVLVSCCVQHGPGDCCHFLEQRVTKKGAPK